MLLTEEIELNVNTYKLLEYYGSKNDSITKLGKYTVKTTILKPGSNYKVKCICDECAIELMTPYCSYHKSINDWEGKYYCGKCSYKNFSLKNYGVENPSQSKLCLDKRKRTNIERFGCEYASQNEEVRNKIKDNFPDTYEKIKKTNLERYGCENSSQNKDIRDKAKATNLERYGVECNFQNEELKEKIRLNNIEKYGVEHSTQRPDVIEQKNKTNLERYGGIPTQNESVKAKIRATNLEKYGFECSSKNKEVRDKMIQTNLEKYGTECVLKNDNIKEKIKKTNIERYGCENPFSNEEIKEKIKEFNLEKYGSENILGSKEFKNKMKLLVYEKYQTLINGERYELLNITLENFEIFDKKYDKSFEIKKDNIYYRLNNNITLSTIENPINSGSGGELLVKNFLEEFEIEFEIHNRNILSGKELDIFLPQYGIAIEYNGVYWHSEKMINNDYHQNKSLKCQSQDIFLIHIFESDWNYNKDIVKSILKKKLNISMPTINSEYCSIYLVNEENTEEFLIMNNIFGSIKSDINIGLYHNNELISIMCLDKHDNNYEIIRLCDKININVIGSYLKLLNFFKSNYKYEEISIYIDFSFFNGNTLIDLGFKYVELTEPQYFIFKKDKKIDNSEYTDDMLKVYSCGYKKLIYND